jgi:hypothetical protein
VAVQYTCTGPSAHLDQSGDIVLRGATQPVNLVTTFL